MKNFSQFLNEEITIKGNTGLPGEENRNEPSYLRGVERKGAEKIAGIRDPRQLFGQIMQLMDRTKRIVRGKETELQNFAEEMIRSVYASVIENVELDIKMVRGGTDEIAQFMEEEDERKKKEQEEKKQQQEEEEEQEEEERPEQKPAYVKSTSRELKLEVDKRKLANNIIQGEAKNTKFIIEMPECKEGLKRILGDRDGEEYHRLCIEISRVADKLDWVIPVDVKADMMERAPEGMAGAVSVDYSGCDNGSCKKKAEDILKNIEEGGDIESNQEEIGELFSEGKPKIKARGIDFPMLLHETVKGIYELIARAGIPEDENVATNVMVNTSSFADEAEDFKYGPYIAGDLRDFINKCPNVDKYPNMREYVFGKLIVLPAEEFLITIKGILMDTPEAREKINGIVNLIISELDEYERQISDYEVKQKLGEFEEEPEEELAAGEEGDDFTGLKPIIDKGKEEEEDYSTMSKSDLQRAVDDALDAGDMEKFKKLTKYLTKESIEIYTREFQRINESHKFHTRRNNI